MPLSASFSRRFASALLTYPYSILVRGFRSDAALEAIRKASENKTPNLVLYNYPSFSGAYGALFAHLYHCRLNLPCLILPFSAVAPFSVEDLCIEGMKTCYFLDFLGPKGFALELAMRTTSKVIGFDHRKSVFSQISPREDSDTNISFYVNIEKGSSTAAYEYFSANFQRLDVIMEVPIFLIDRLMQVSCCIRFLEFGWAEDSMGSVCAYEGLELMGIQTSVMKWVWNSAEGVQLLGYGDLLSSLMLIGLDIAPNPLFIFLLANLGYSSTASGAVELSLAIGAVIYMQRNNLKMCLRTVDNSTDTSEVAKAYGGGGSPSSSSFIIRMDEYNQWLSTQSPPRRSQFSFLQNEQHQVFAFGVRRGQDLHLLLVFSNAMQETVTSPG
ncbi:hypothetical protein Sango_0920400 [Sesamum angolense]|uniref:Uncharacterized protein n=1 Tax=Sesamum angolense TaxID=2727404 RepID=A0AAE1WY57_9LAMI|nr:hypothetical protein Sango_0920400 [Sesamum angolense]